MTKHTLEHIADTGIPEERLHTGLLLAYASALYGVVRKECVPSPLYRVIYDEKNNNLIMEETAGHSLVPLDNALDISDVDTILMANVRDIPILLEGETGVGKTFVAQRYLATVLPVGNYFSQRLSANAFVNNLFNPFQEGRMVNGMPVVTARTDVIEKTGAGIVDEINRSESNETLQLFDNEMHLGGVIYKLGIPIPVLLAGKYQPQSGRLKKLLLVTAQNPAGADDAKFTQTLQLDAAVDNRLLKTYVGNAAPSAGSTLWLLDARRKPHDAFLTQFAAKGAHYLNVDKSLFASLGQDWLSLYAWITESARTDKPILYSALELADMMIATFSGELLKYYEYEKRIVNDWDKKLHANVDIALQLNETERIKKIHEVIQTFKVPIIFRDVVQIKKLADVLATLKNVKDALRSPKPVDAYQNMKRYVTVREVAGAVALLARNKQRGNASSPVNAVNEVLTEYITIAEEYMKEAGYLSAAFDLFDPNAGVRKVAVFKSLKETMQSGKGVDYLVDKITEQAKKLTRKMSASKDLRNIFIVRTVADLMTLCGFLLEYKTDIGHALAEADKKTKLTSIVEAMGAVYHAKQDGGAMVMPDIYQHRIQRTLGI